MWSLSGTWRRANGRSAQGRRPTAGTTAAWRPRHSGAHAHHTTGRPLGLKYAYYLFRRGKSEGCAECYVPLLLTASPIGTSAATPEAEVIVTYERDSIWEIRDGPATLTELEPRARTLRLER